MAAPAPLAGAGRVAGAAALIAVLTVASRLAGFGRTGIFTWVVGDTDLGGVYVVANTVPNIVFEIVAGGALASLVVPLLAGAVAAGDRRSVAETTGALLTWTVTLLVPLAVLVAVFAGPIVSLIIGDPTPAQRDAGAGMLRVFAPQLPLYGIGIVLTGVLQAHRRFAWPVLAPLLSSLTVIGVYLLFGGVEGRHASIAQVEVSGQLILSIGTTLGVVVLSGCLIVPVSRLGLRPRPGYGFSAENRRRIGGLALAGAVTVTGQQIALLVMLRLAADASVGNPVVLNLAQTMYLLPWAVLAVPLAVAAYPTLVAAYATGDEETFRRTLAPTTRGVLLLSCLGAAALIATAEPVARFFDFGSESAAAIAGFGPGLLGYGVFAVLSRALYARGDNRAAAATTAAGWLVVPVAAVGLSRLLPDADRLVAVTSANSIGMLVLGTLLVVVVARRAGRSMLDGLARSALVGLAAGAVATLAGIAVLRWLPGLFAGTPAKVDALLQGMLSGVVVGAVFLAVSYPLDRHDVRPMIGSVGRRLSRLTRRKRSGGGPDGPHPGRGDEKETVSG
ncbi:murein biosynthesis integral membrane protein MurJ [Micromonospora sp. NBC_01796]|uniref:murein biosynthesis integral membrane protein MurJ n=1 Tax=Micromonospora sp. NBC_01796 TaxID=2975987 RepID=UPI002DDA20A8|nr:lipid II flippase MurJ [Micromonospora sp. NBC_01796]WSA86041.1 MATE family efflux transporter [Micromonospora sp. NBC_01796]